MSIRVFFAAAAIVAAVGIPTAHADITSGGVFDKINGPYFAVNSRRGSARTKYRSNKRIRKTKRRSRLRHTYRTASRTNYSSGSRYRVGRRPRKWCGWWMRTQKGGGPKYNVAWNWRHYGRPTSPQVGAIVVWRHHVGIITGRASNGRWIVKSGNDGGRVRERARSVRGAIFRI